ncbi:MAG: hypothetical protein LJE70_04740 [Chromatiaceae bacterium]|jgi:hypothetical protein|nr:hypothetical protein [Chromatiaceae bacterium]
MADAMARMMEAMGLFDSAPVQQGFGGAPADPMAMMGPLGSSAWGPALGAPWDGPVRDPSRGFAMRDLMQQFARQMATAGDSRGDRPIAWTPSRLEGVWEGRSGELLIVQGNRFRIYSPAVQRVDGLMQIRGDRLALYNPLDQHAQAFEFAESQGRLILRDLAGQVYLYRRLRLDGGQGSSVIQAPYGR